eukprot:scaffold239099_cov28-Tisochrysis_lutea.AAC.2
MVSPPSWRVVCMAARLLLASACPCTNCAIAASAATRRAWSVEVVGDVGRGASGTRAPAEWTASRSREASAPLWPS